MSPIDDELRAVLTARAGQLQPSPDLLAGVERRARRIRRNRVAASVAGTALVISGFVLVVPALTTDGSVDRVTPPTATQPPTPTPAPSPASMRFELDPAAPWPYRGTADLGQGFLETAQREWQVRHPGSELVPLFGQIYEPSGRAELVFLGRGDPQAADGLRWGVVTESEAGPEFVHDADLFQSERLGMAVALPGEEVLRLLVVAAPGTTVDYAPAGQSLQPMVALADGVGTGPLEPGPDGDYYAVRAPDGSVVKEVGAPDRAPALSRGEGDPGTVAGVPPPANALDWPTRGGLLVDLYEQAVVAFAAEVGAERGDVGARLLYAGQRGDRVVVLLQAWARGQDASSFGYVIDTSDLAGRALPGRVLRPEDATVALLVPAAPGESTDALLVVPSPAAREVRYSPDGGEPLSVRQGSATGTAQLIDRAPGAEGDTLLVLDGSGERDRALYDGDVAGLLR